MNEPFEQDIHLIRDLQLLKECLELRLSLIGQNNSLKTEFELNEDDITRIKTQIEIAKLNALIDQKTFDVIHSVKMAEVEQAENK